MNISPLRGLVHFHTYNYKDCVPTGHHTLCVLLRAASRTACRPSAWHVSVGSEKAV